MNFDLSEEQRAISELAAEIFERTASPDRLRAIAESADRFDAVLWSRFANANLLGTTIPEKYGGTDMGLVALCLVLEQQGRRLAPIPLLWTETVAHTIRSFAAETISSALLTQVATGSLVVSAGLEAAGAYEPAFVALDVTADGEAWRVSGCQPGVPYAQVARLIMVAARDRALDQLVVGLIDPHDAGVSIEMATGTSGEWFSHLSLDGAPFAFLIASGRKAEQAIRSAMNIALVGLAALQVGIAGEALTQAASYTASRLQFGRPVATFQATAMRAADSYIDVEAMRLTTLEAAWLLERGLPAAESAHVAKWWASEAGQRVVHAVQHMHGGIGADVTYPIHRYFLWAKQVENTLGSGSAHLAAIGRELAQS